MSRGIFLNLFHNLKSDWSLVPDPLITLSIKRDWVQKISHFQKNFQHAMSFLGYSAKLKRGLGLAFGANFLHGYSIKMFHI